MNVAEIQNAPFPDPYGEARYGKFNALIETYGKEYFIGADVSGTLFELAYHLRSMEKLMTDLAEENDEADIFLDRFRDFSAKVSIRAKEVYSQMLEKTRILSKGGGYVGTVSHTIQHDIPVENIMSLVQALDDFTPLL
jgi:hypothetical protein